MCGIAGFVSAGMRGDGIGQVLSDMGRQLAHRGPDDDGTWFEDGVGFAHRRLAVIDTTQAGHQPMASRSGRYVICYNGEIYNHLDLRRDLAQADREPGWQGHSDTETLLACFDRRGIKQTLQDATGMFAMAVWDREERVLTLARDRLGEKPLYCGWQNRSFLFGSELKPLQVHPDFRANLDRDALSLLLRLAYIPAPYSIYQGIRKLTPGCMLRLKPECREPEIEPYWSAEEAIRRSISNPFEGDPVEAVDELERRAGRAVERQMISDVPLGAFLSGGIDSSTVVALAQSASSKPVRTFSIGFTSKAYDEADYARAVAGHLQTDHEELYVEPSDLLDVIPTLPTMYDEPFADSSQIPTFLVSQLARQHVTVALSGDGGDELFSGYNRYVATSLLWNRITKIPRALRQAASKLILAVPPSAWDRLVMNSRMSRKVANPGEKLHKTAAILDKTTADEVYAGLTAIHQCPGDLLADKDTLAPGAPSAMIDVEQLDDVERMMAMDLLTYLPDDILAKVDRAAMSISLETRVPFLDHHLVEFAWSLPLSLKLRDGENKWILRQVLYRHVPRELFDRPKMGFALPLADWLRGPLKEWAGDLLARQRVLASGILDADAVGRTWEEHQSGRRDHSKALWALLMFQAWEDSMERSAPVPLVA